MLYGGSEDVNVGAQAPPITSTLGHGYVTA
jgi:hypothetical protein